MDTFEALFAFFTSSEGLSFLALWITLDGLLVEIAGVFIILAGDYHRLRKSVHRMFDLPRVEKIDQLREELNGKQLDLRDDNGFSSMKDYQEVTDYPGDDEGILEYVLFKPEGGIDEISEIGFTAQTDDPQVENIRLTVSTEELDNVQFTNNELDSRVQQARRHTYYWYGAVLVMLGFGLMAIATLLEIVSYGLQ